MTMADTEVNGVKGLDREELEHQLHSSSTKQRISDLHALNHRLADNNISSADALFVTELLFNTHVLYADRASRLAVQQCLQTLIKGSFSEHVLALLVKLLTREASKTNVAPSNAFVLAEIVSLLLRELAVLPGAWNKWGLQLINAQAKVLEVCLGSDARDSLKKSALVVSRRALRSVFKSEAIGADAIKSSVSALAAKGGAATAKNAILLGVIAGTCARLPAAKPVLETEKKQYYAFYVREILGSRTVLPRHIADGLHDFFDAYPTLEEVQVEIMPSLEKSLLRAPEVVLNDLVRPMVDALPADLDLSDVLHKHLLKSILSNVKSTNATIRDGALLTFDSIAARCKTEETVNKIADEILNPLKQGKVTGAEQKALHAQMLVALNGNATLAVKVPTGLASTALKETNEQAVNAESRAIAEHLKFAFANDIAVDAAVTDAFVKGLNDKKPAVRRIWTLRTGEILWDMTPERFSQPALIRFAQLTVTKLNEVAQEYITNAISAAQNGSIAIAYILLALVASKLKDINELKESTNKLRNLLLKQTLVGAPKPSFLLNQRVYSKLTAEDDLLWLVRSLVAIEDEVSKSEEPSSSTEAWAQAFLYCITAHGIPPKIRKEAVRSLAAVHKKRPQPIGKIVVAGLWQWYRHVAVNEKESAAVSARTGNEQLHLAVRAITSSVEEIAAGQADGKDVLEDQLISLLILVKPQIIPNLSWIDLCLRCSVDPGELVHKRLDQCLKEIKDATESPENLQFPAVQQAAYDSAAELAFVAPDVVIPELVRQIHEDLNPEQLKSIGPTEAAIFRTPEGTAFVDVLSKKGQDYVVDKNVKDYDTLKWEQELREQLAQKKGQTKKLTAEEQAQVNAQLAKESKIRKEVAGVESKLKRGIGMVKSLATGPPIDAELWLGPAVSLLTEAIQSGAGLLVGDAAAVAFIKCADKISPRLGAIRPFVGSATLRAIGTAQLPSGMEEEPLGDLVTRVLYRLRFLGEQRPLDTASLIYCLPLIFLVLEKGGVGWPAGDEADEQLLLAIEVLTFHADAFADKRLPRKHLLETLIASLRKYNQHYKLIKDCIMDVCRGLASNISIEEISCLVQGVIVPEVAVRTSVLQAIDSEIDLTVLDWCKEIWVACHDDVDENVRLAKTIWEDNGLELEQDSAYQMLPYLQALDKQLRRAAARALAEAVANFADNFHDILEKLRATYIELAKERAPERDQYGMPRKMDIRDPWEARDGVALAFRELAPLFPPADLVSFMQFLVRQGPLSDRNSTVRDEMIDAATMVISSQGRSKVEELMQLFEQVLENSDGASEASDSVNEAVVILYGALARHLPTGDKRVPKVVQRLLGTLSVPSETVQYAVAECLPPLIQASQDEAHNYAQQMMDQLLQSKKYAERRGAAYGLAAIVRGRGIIILREYRILSTLKAAAENKKDVNQRQGAFLAYELLSLILGRMFEPYVIQLVHQLLAGFGDSSADVREACLDAAKVCFGNLSSYGVNQVLPTLLEGLDEPQWRSKKGACDSLGAMAYLDPQQLALSLPEIIPPLTNVLTDSHKEVRASANRSLQRFGEVINNPEIKSTVGILLKALSDPTKYTDDALDALIKVNFVHYLDAPSLALVVRILERGLADRSATKRKSAQIIGSLAHLTERKDLVAHLPILVAGLRVAVVDPVPQTRATASKALGSLIEKLGEDALPDLIPSLMATLKSDTGAGDRLGSAQALSEVLAGLGTVRLEETLPSILQNVSSSKPSVREGFMSLFIFLPACFGNSFANYLSRIIPPILSGLADEVDSIRETALRAGRLLVKNFATRSIDLLLPELERGLADDNHRIRLSSVELVGDLLFNLTGISGKAEQDEVEEGAKEAGQSLLEVLGEEKRNRVLSSLYICRCDTSGLVRTAAINVWKALVATPRTLRELIPTLTQLIIRRLASSNMEQKVIAGNALGELIRKAGEGVLASLLPTLEEGLHSTDTDAKQGICIAMRELISSAAPEALEEHEKTLISVVRTALVDPDADVREAAAEAFDSLQRIFGKRAVDQVLPYLLNLLRSEDEAQNALSALLTLLTDATRSNIILPNLLPTLLTSPISAFNAKAIASLAEVASSAMTRRLPNILNAIMDSIVNCDDVELRAELESAFDGVLLSVDEFDGLSTAMSVMLALAKHDDHRKRVSADLHLAHFFSHAGIDISRYYPDLIRALLVAFDDGDKEVVKAAWTALSELTKRLKKEEMESLVVSTRQVLNQVGVPGRNLPGFELPKGINAILPIFLQGLMNGTADQRTQAALAISDIIARTSGESLRPFVTQITGPLIRVVSERSVDVKAAILFTLNNLLEKIPTYLKPFLPQLQRTFAKSLADTSSEILRIRAAKALGTLITLTPRIDPLIAELVTGSKTSDHGVKTAMLKALYEVVSKAGTNMNEASRSAILGLIDAENDDADDAMAITYARLLGALIKVLPEDVAGSLIRSRVLTSNFSKASVLALNAILLESPEALTEHFGEETVSTICSGIEDSQPVVSDNCVLAAGKYLLTPSSNKGFEVTKPIFEALAPAVQPGKPVDTRRLALVVLRTVSREHNDLVRPHLALLAPPVFAGVRDMVIPVKLAAEAAFLSIFSVVDEESAVFEKYLAGPGASLPPNVKRSMQDYFKRVATRLGTQARERKEAEGGQGGLGLSSDEKEDEREVWSVGRVDLGEAGSFEA